MDPLNPKIESYKDIPTFNIIKFKNEDDPNINEYLSRIKGFQYTNTIYRGERNFSSWKLIPKIGRPEYLKPFGSRDNIMVNYEMDKNSIRQSNDKHLIREFNLRLPSFKLEYADTTLKNWYSIIIAQHHGLPTRLLDFTKNPLVALYFALEEEKNGKGYHAVWCINISSGLIKSFDQLQKFDYWRTKQPFIFYPPHIDNRIPAQQSLFVFHPDPLIPLEKYYRFRFTKAKRYPKFKIDPKKIAPIIVKHFKGITQNNNLADKDINIKKINKRHWEIRCRKTDKFIIIEDNIEGYDFLSSDRFNFTYFHKIKIKYDPYIRLSLLEDLDHMGINRETLFPDLDGVAEYLKKKIKIRI